MHTDKKDASTYKLLYWYLDPVKLKSTFSIVARHSLPSAPASWCINQDTLCHWERAAREQTFMCNQAAGLSRCLTRVQNAMVAQLKTLHLDKGQGKAPGRSQQAVDELDYLVTFSRSITQVMARTMQDLSEGTFVNMVNLTHTRKDSYLEYLRTGVKQDTVRVLSNVNDNCCVKCVIGLKNCACVSGEINSLNPSPVIAGNKNGT